MTSIRTSPEPAAGAPALVIRADGVVARIDQPPREVLEELVVGRRAFAADGRGGVRRDWEPEDLFDLDPDGRLAFFAGLVPRVAAAARRAGYAVEVRDEGEPTIAAAPVDDLGLDPDRRRLAADLAGCRRGVVLALTRADRIATIDLILELFAPGRVMIVTKTRDEAREISRALRAGRREPVACYTRQRTQSDIRVQVGTAGGLDLADARVVIFADATQALHEGIRNYRDVLRRQRIYGLLDPRVDPARRERLVIEACLGPVVGRVGPAGAPTPDVVAVFADWPGGERPDEPLGLGWKRGSIWDNAERNAAVARLANALAGGDAEVLWGSGLFLDEEIAGLPDALRIAVLVESAEHARALGRLLPGWRLLHAGGEAPVDAGGGAAGGPDLSIVTMTCAHDRGRLAADVVIRADGTPWPLDLPLRADGPVDGGGRPVLLVDLADHQDGTARDATRRRWLAYRRRGWASGREPIPSPADPIGGML